MHPRRILDAPTKEAMFVVAVVLGALVGATIGIAIWLSSTDSSAEATVPPPPAAASRACRDDGDRCGRDDPAETAPAETAPAAGEGEAVGGDPAAGKVVFTANCGGCHTLADAGTSGTIGPVLDDAKPPYDHVVERVTNGMGAMPSFQGVLSEADIQNVAGLRLRGDRRRVAVSGRETRPA